MSEDRETNSQRLEDAWQTLQSSTSKSLLKRYLTRDVFERLKDARTSSGATLLDVIQSGVKNLDSGVGIYAADAESYRVFGLLFDPIIAHYHRTALSGRRQPSVDFGDPSTFKDLDPERKYIISTRIRCGRSLQGYPLNPKLTKAQYLDLESEVRDAITNGFTGELKGSYFPLDGMSEEVRQQLVDDHFLFKSGDRFLEAANANRYLTPYSSHLRL
jgi:arginine kinase